MSKCKNSMSNNLCMVTYYMIVAVELKITMVSMC